jgi:hypothetical protein
MDIDSDARPPSSSRVELTVAVRDTDAIPKVPDAGTIRMHEGRRVQVMHNGVLIEEGCYYGDWMSEIIKRLRGHHEPQEEVVFHAVVDRLRQDTPGAVMVELGSYWAYYSLWFKRAVPEATCVLVEPASEYLEVGLRNFELNGETATAVRGSIGVAYGTDTSGEPTPLLTIRGLMDDLGIKRIDLLHCDTQGGELPMLQDTREPLSQGRIRFLIVSTHHHSTTGDPLTHQRCLRLLQHAGAHIIAEHTVSESCSADGLIACSMDPRDVDLKVRVTHVRSRDTIHGEMEYELAAAMHQPPLRQRVRARLGQTAQLGHTVARPCLRVARSAVSRYRS